MPPTSTPPDRSHIQTEQRNPRSMSLHTMSVAQCVELIQQEDRAVLDAMDHARPALTKFLEAAESRFVVGVSPHGPGRLISLGAGTSGRLAVLDASECPPTFQTPPDRVIGLIAGGDSALRVSSEGKEDDPAGAIPELAKLVLTPSDIVVGVAAGGTTPYVLGALEYAHSQGCLTAFIFCAAIENPAFVDHLIHLPTGPEVLTGSTRMKAGTATKLALNTISTTLMVRSGRVYENLMVDLRATNDKLRDRAARIISMLTKLPRQDALGLLDQAGGSVKIAMVMHNRQVDRTKAEAFLHTSNGRLDFKTL